MNKESLDNHFYGHGKLLLSSEYFVLDGALALALPTKFGQHLEVEYKKSYDPHLVWEGYDVNDNLWFSAKFELWHFDFIDTEENAKNITLQNILRSVRKQNAHFLRDENMQIKVKTKLEFPLNWGLGSSSTLIYNIAQWAYVSPFELLFDTLGGSGYDIACAQSQGPILYEKNKTGPHWSIIEFNPSFKDDLYFVYLGQKQSTYEAIDFYNQQDFDKEDLRLKLSSLTHQMTKAETLKDFEFLIQGHENIISKTLKMTRAKDLFFSDYEGEIKSLGAWGGDFVLATSSKSYEETKSYFNNKGFDTVMKFDEMIMDTSATSTKKLH